MCKIHDNLVIINVIGQKIFIKFAPNFQEPLYFLLNQRMTKQNQKEAYYSLS